MKITKDTFVIADPHFGHKNVTEFEPSRALTTTEGSYENQEEMLIDRWNKTVKKKDTVLILGDYAWKNIKGFTERLNGKKVLIRGNHDRRGDHAYISAGFDMVFNGIHYTDNNGNNWVHDSRNSYLSAAILEVEGHRLLLSHYPVDFYEDYYTKQRSMDLSDTIKELSDAVRPLRVAINIHGHTHSKIVPDTATMKYLNVSCENTDFSPIRIGDLLEAAGC